MEPFAVDPVRYLAAKRSVDDRAINRRVWASLLDEVVQHRPTGTDPFRIVELGAGIGTMVERLVDWGLFAVLSEDGRRPTRVAMELVDHDAGALAAARRRLPEAAAARGWAAAASPHGGVRLSGPAVELDVHLHAAPVEHFLHRWPPGGAQLVLAHAFLDLFSLEELLPGVLGLLGAAGLCWFTITFDGVTILEPEVEPELDRLVRSVFHQSMGSHSSDGSAADPPTPSEARPPGGDRRASGPRAGRHLFHVVRGLGAEVLDVGSSDWIVFPRRDGYPADEAYFLRCILATIESAVAGDPRIAAGALEHWLTRRRQQVDHGELLYIAHQLDLLGRRPHPGS